MKDKKEFVKIIHSILFSWGGDAPSEAVWAANDMLEFFEKETNEIIGHRFEEDLSNHEMIFQILGSLS